MSRRSRRLSIGGYRAYPMTREEFALYEHDGAACTVLTELFEAIDVDVAPLRAPRAKG